MYPEKPYSTAGELVIGFPHRGDSLGGSHISAMLLMKQLRAKGVTVKPLLYSLGPVANLLARHDLNYTIIEHAAALRTRSKSAFAWRLLEGYARLGRWVNENRVSIIHTNEPDEHMSWNLLCRRFGVHHIWHQRSGSWPRHPPLLRWNPDAVISISGFVRNMLPIELAKRSLVIDNPFEAPRAGWTEYRDTALLRSQLASLRKTTHTIATVSNYWPRKNLGIIPGILKTLFRDFGLDVSWVVLGRDKSNLRSGIELEAQRLGVADRLHLLGFYEDVNQVYGYADLLVAPADREPFGRTLVEAMLQGVPVVASRSGGHEEILAEDGNGILCRPGDGDHFAEAIAGLLTNAKVRSHIGEQARVYAERRFSAERHADEVLGVYRSVLGGA